MTGRKLFKNFRKRKSRKELVSTSVAQICAEICAKREKFKSGLRFLEDDRPVVKVEFKDRTSSSHVHYIELEVLASALYQSLLVMHLMDQFHDNEHTGSDPIETLQHNLLAYQETDNRLSFPTDIAQFVGEKAERLYWLASLLGAQEEDEKGLFRAFFHVANKAAEEDIKLLQPTGSPLQRFLEWFSQKNAEEKTTQLIKSIGKQLPKLYDASSYALKSEDDLSEHFQRTSSLKKCIDQFRSINYRSRDTDEDNDKPYYGP